jgi:hypothetical protein
LSSGLVGLRLGLGDLTRMCLLVRMLGHWPTNNKEEEVERNNRGEKKKYEDGENVVAEMLRAYRWE